jgi:hypothetical protein
MEMQSRLNEEYVSETPLTEHLWLHYGYDPTLQTWTPAIEIVTRLETLGLRGNQNQHLKDLSIAMKKIGARKAPKNTGSPILSGVYKNDNILFYHLNLVLK